MSNDQQASLTQPEMVTLTIDDRQVTVPKGTNLIEAALQAGVEIPYYCYHPHLSIAGNCRMCQVEIEGARKLEIGCNMGAQDGMVVRTHLTSDKVEQAQRATLEFLLINHPLDCTVCDAAGHCKLQDYHYQYNGKASRFVEDKVEQVKAKSFGPEIVFDGERCIVCTRCVRFCDEVSETGELGVYHRGDKAVIDIHSDKELDNPLAGCVVDLCPVGALTHKRWRFNTRIWNTKEEDTICTGCSTGCNAKVAVRDDKIVYVKGRLNSEVNQEWMCDEGRYGFDRFQPKHRLEEPLVKKDGDFVTTSWDDALQQATALKGTPEAAKEVAVFLSPFLTMEEVWTGLEFARNVMGANLESASVAMQLHIRSLNEVEAKLISPDYAPNARSANLFGLGDMDGDWRIALQEQYQRLIGRIKRGDVKRVLLVGDNAVRNEDVNLYVLAALESAEVSVALTPRDSRSEVASGEIERSAVMGCKIVLPTRTVNEKNGVMINQQMRLQRMKALLTPPFGTYPEWMVLQKIAAMAKQKVLPESVSDDRALFRHVVGQATTLQGLSLAKLGEWGMTLADVRDLKVSEGSEAQHAGA